MQGLNTGILSLGRKIAVACHLTFRSLYLDVVPGDVGLVRVEDHCSSTTSVTAAWNWEAKTKMIRENAARGLAIVQKKKKKSEDAGYGSNKEMSIMCCCSMYGHRMENFGC